LFLKFTYKFQFLSSSLPEMCFFEGKVIVFAGGLFEAFSKRPEFWKWLKTFAIIFIIPYFTASQFRWAFMGVFTDNVIA
jgi:hypothetical protein